MVDPRVGETSHGELPGADIAEHLARHGLRVEVVSLPREGVTAGVAILRHAREVGAQLVVAGGYGHSRMRQLRSEEHTSELQSLMRISYAVFCLKKKQHT